MSPAISAEGEKGPDDQAREPHAAIPNPYPDNSAKCELRADIQHHSLEGTAWESYVSTTKGAPTTLAGGLGLAASRWAPASITTSALAFQTSKPDTAAISNPVGPSPSPSGAGLGASRWAPTGNSSMGKMDVTKQGE